MLGCYSDSALLNAPRPSCLPLVRWPDLDSHLNLINDRFEGRPIAAGEPGASPSLRPGLGVIAISAMLAPTAPIVRCCTGGSTTYPARPAWPVALIPAGADSPEWGARGGFFLGVFFLEFPGMPAAAWRRSPASGRSVARGGRSAALSRLWAPRWRWGPGLRWNLASRAPQRTAGRPSTRPSVASGSAHPPWRRP